MNRYLHFLGLLLLMWPFVYQKAQAQTPIPVDFTFCTGTGDICVAPSDSNYKLCLKLILYAFWQWYQRNHLAAYPRDRWGEILFEAKNIPPQKQDLKYAWDSTLENKKMPADMYVE
ncbi:MAG: hypothetical protein ACK4GN_04185 [Runella sp.]